MAKDIVLAMGSLPKLGAKQPMPRSFNKGYKGSMMLDREQPEADESEQPVDDAPDELLVGAADDVLQAQHARDPEAFAAALKAFVQMV